MAKKYIDADLLQKEIEKRMHICDGVFERDSDTYYQGKAVAYQETLSLIDSLQQEQPTNRSVTTKELIRQEIERRKELLTPHKGQGVILCREIIKQFNSLLSFIDTIPQPIVKDDIIDEIRTEIERRFLEYNHDSSHHIQAAECASILDFLDTLNPIQQEQPSEELEKYASRAGFDYVDDIESKYPDHRWNDHDVEFAYRDGIIAGAEWQKEQMLKDAVEGEVYRYEGYQRIATAIIVDIPREELGNKVKFVIVKEGKE